MSRHRSLLGTGAAVAVLGTPVGRLGVAVTDAGLARVWWADPGIAPGDGAASVESSQGAAGDEVSSAAAPGSRAGPVVEQLTDYFAGRRTAFELPLDWRFTRGTQQAVLQTLLATVEFGRSVTYGELAARSGTGVPARAVGGIMGSNPLPVVVPCHRVLAHDGLGGYSGGTGRGGLEVKRWLLTHEGVLPPTLDWNPTPA